MTYVIAEPCIDVTDLTCVEVCPVDCIHPTEDELGVGRALPSRLNLSNPQGLRQSSRSSLVVTMPTFRVTVTASLRHTDLRAGKTRRNPFSMEDTSAPPAGLVRALNEWVSSAPGRSVESDQSIDPPRATVLVVYDDVDAADAWEARVDSESRFRDECVVVDRAEWESVLALADEAE